MEDDFNEKAKQKNRLGYYFIGYKDEDSCKGKCLGCILDSLNIQLEDYIRICKHNGATNFNNYSEVDDLFITPYQAQIAMQELLEFSVEYNKCRDCGDCDCDDEEDPSVVIPIFPNAFKQVWSPTSTETDNETINDIIQCCISQLEDNLEQDAIEISTGNVLVVVNRKITSVGNCDEDCCGCDSYSYDVKVCKNYYEFIGDNDSCEMCNTASTDEDLSFFKE